MLTFLPVPLQQLLECNKCRNSYHPECLGPNYPTKPTKKKKVWVSERSHTRHFRGGQAHGQQAQLRAGTASPRDVGVTTSLPRYWEKPFQWRSQL